jgi:hypothetical protein
MVDPITGRPGMTPASLRIVRYAMLVGILLFGALAYYQASNRVPMPGEEGADVSMLRWVGLGLCAAAMVGIFVLRGVRERAEAAARPTFGLIGSALAEGAALLGAVIVFLGGDPVVYALGVVLFLATWTLLPADSEAT